MFDRTKKIDAAPIPTQFLEDQRFRRILPGFSPALLATNVLFRVYTHPGVSPRFLIELNQISREILNFNLT